MHFIAYPYSHHSTVTLCPSVLYEPCPQHSSMLSIVPSSVLCQHNILLLLPHFFWSQILDGKFPDPYLCKTGGFIASLPISKLFTLPRLTCCKTSLTAFLYPAPHCLRIAAEARTSASERSSAHFSDVLTQLFIYQNTTRHLCLKKVKLGKTYWHRSNPKHSYIN